MHHPHSESFSAFSPRAQCVLLWVCLTFMGCADKETSLECFSEDFAICSKLTNFNEDTSLVLTCPEDYIKVSKCPQDDVIAECVYGGREETQLLHNYYYEDIDLEDLQDLHSDCREYVGEWSGQNPFECEDSTQEDCCQYAKDGECDEPNFCAPGTDTTDCDGAGGGCDAAFGPDCCKYAKDGVCDDPTGTDQCDWGTDTTDCTKTCEANPWPNCCEYARDGACDEPDLCAPGTDTVDCSGEEDDCSLNIETCCLYTQDGVCDEPSGSGLCPEGTDTADCGAKVVGVCLDACTRPAGLECGRKQSCVASLSGDVCVVVAEDGQLSAPNGAASCEAENPSCADNQRCVVP